MTNAGVDALQAAAFLRSMQEAFSTSGAIKTKEDLAFLEKKVDTIFSTLATLATKADVAALKADVDLRFSDMTAEMNLRFAERDKKIEVGLQSVVIKLSVVMACFLGPGVAIFTLVRYFF